MQTAANIISAITGAPPSNFGGIATGVAGAAANGTNDTNPGDGQPSFGDVLAISVANEATPSPTLPALPVAPVNPNPSQANLTVVPATPATPSPTGLFLVSPSATTPPVLEQLPEPVEKVAPIPDEDPATNLVEIAEGAGQQDLALASAALPAPLPLPVPLQAGRQTASAEPPPALPTTVPQAGAQPTPSETLAASAQSNSGALPAQSKLGLAAPSPTDDQLLGPVSLQDEPETPTPQAAPVLDKSAPGPTGAPAAAAQLKLATQTPVTPTPAAASPAETPVTQALATAQPAPETPQPEAPQTAAETKATAAPAANLPKPAPAASQPSVPVPAKGQEPAVKTLTIDTSAQTQVQVQIQPETQVAPSNLEFAATQTPIQGVIPAKPVISAQTTTPSDKPEDASNLTVPDAIESELASVVAVAQTPKAPSAPIAPTDKPNTAVTPTQAQPTSPASPALEDQDLPENTAQLAQQDQAEGEPAQTAPTPLGTPVKGTEALSGSTSTAQTPTRSAPAHPSSEPAPTVVAANATASSGANAQSNPDQGGSDSSADPSVINSSIKMTEVSPAGTLAEAAEPPTIAPIAQSNAAPTTGTSVQVAANAQTVSHLASEIVRKSDGKSAQFDISLTPEGLGKVDVQISINQRGEVTASMVFDTPQAAAELRGRAAELQKSLEQSGFQVSQGGLSFTDTSGQGFSAAQQQAQQEDRRAAAQNRPFVAANDVADTVDLAAAKAYASNSTRNIDVRI